MLQHILPNGLHADPPISFTSKLPVLLTVHYPLSCIADIRRQNLAVAANRLLSFTQIASGRFGTTIAILTNMFEPIVSIPQQSTTCAPYSSELVGPVTTSFPNSRIEPTTGVFAGLLRRLRRERRRRTVGRAYDMALEITRVIPHHSQVIDVGCGNGYIAHHLSALLGSEVIGIDLDPRTEAPIDYRQFDGTHFPVGDQSVDAVLLCYVLHHAQDLSVVMSELRRVLRYGGLAVIYEDIPECWWDRLVCWTHNLKWQGRTGRCTFRSNNEWRRLFGFAGFELITERELSRWRNLLHPVNRKFFLLKRNSAGEE